jgi:hypothetical protein
MKVVSIEMDKARNLKFGINSLIELEKKINKPLTKLTGEGFALSDLRAILYIGLKWEDKSLTEEQTGEIMDSAIEKFGIEYISKKLEESMTTVFRGVKESPIPS